MVEGCTVSPRKSRRKSACFSSTTASTPARASRTPSITPAGPPPTMQQWVSMRVVITLLLTFDRSLRQTPIDNRYGQDDASDAAARHAGSPHPESPQRRRTARPRRLAPDRADHGRYVPGPAGLALS